MHRRRYSPHGQCPNHRPVAAGHLLGFILVGPAALLLWPGVYLVAFSGHVAVGTPPEERSPPRRDGRSSSDLFGSLGCIGGTSHAKLSDGEVNRYWLVFWPTFLLLLTCLCSGAALSLRVIGDRRTKESNVLWFVSGFTFSLIVLAMTIDGSAVDAGSFRYHLWLAGADLLGTAAGFAIAILVFGGVIMLHERSLEEPPSVHPPTSKEFEHVAAIVSANLGGEESE